MDSSDMPPTSEQGKIIVSVLESVKRDDSEPPPAPEPIASGSQPIASALQLIASTSKPMKNIVSAAEPSMVPMPKPIQNIVSMPEPSMVSTPKPIRNIVLVGRTGNGKSATGNSIIGKKVFMARSQATRVTTTCETYKIETPDGLVINMIDTPGLFDMTESAVYMSKEIINYIKFTAGGIHVVVLVISLRTRITQEEENILSTLQSLFGIEIMNYLIVLFTGGDELEANNITLDTYLSHSCPEFLKTILRLSESRKMIFDNRTTDEGKKVDQVKQFLDLVTMIGARNGGKPYLDDMYYKIKEEAERLMEQKNEVEAQNLVERELEMMKLQISYKQQIEEMMEDKLRMMYELQKSIQMSQREINYLCDEKNEPRRRFCNIL